MATFSSNTLDVRTVLNSSCRPSTMQDMFFRLVHVSLDVHIQNGLVLLNKNDLMLQVSWKRDRLNAHKAMSYHPTFVLELTKFLRASLQRLL